MVALHSTTKPREPNTAHRVQYVLAICAHVLVICVPVLTKL